MYAKAITGIGDTACQSMQTHTHGIKAYSKITAKARIIPYDQTVVDIPAQTIARAAGPGPKSIVIGQAARIRMQRNIDLTLGYGVDVYVLRHRIVTNSAGGVPDHVLGSVIARRTIRMTYRRAVIGR